MDKQQEQMTQNQNQEVEYISAFLDENEEVNESEFEELSREQEAGKLEDRQQNELEEEEPTKRPKRPRKTIEQEIAELDAKRERLMEKKRRQDAHEKIVFGATVIAMIQDWSKTNDEYKQIFCNKLKYFIDKKNQQTKDIVLNILNNIK